MRDLALRFAFGQGVGVDICAPVETRRLRLANVCFEEAVVLTGLIVAVAQTNDDKGIARLLKLIHIDVAVELGDVHAL